MAKFRFFQDKEVKTWVRDYFTIEADTLEEAIKIIEDADTSINFRDLDIVARYTDMDKAFEHAEQLNEIYNR